MTLELAAPSPDRIFEQFKFNEVWENPAFRACYQQTLRGAETGWKLVSIEVMCGYLSMEFASEKRYQELEGSDDHDTDSPYYNESVYLSLKGQGYARLRFDVERADGLGFEVYKVDISQKHTKVTEFIGHQKRIIDFLPSTPDEIDSHKPHQWVKVSSYC